MNSNGPRGAIRDGPFAQAHLNPATSPIGRRPARQDASTLPMRRRSRAAVRAFARHSDQPARANVPAGSALQSRAPAVLHPRIGFAPETIAPSAICRAKIVRHASIAGWLRLAMRGKAGDDDGIFDIAGAVRPDRDCGLGGARVSGNIATFASAFPTNKAHYPLCQAKP